MLLFIKRLINYLVIKGMLCHIEILAVKEAIRKTERRALVQNLAHKVVYIF